MSTDKAPLPFNNFESEQPEINFGKILQIFADSKYGAKLKGELRYDRYRPPALPKDEWQKLLGADVNNLKHLDLTYGLARQFLIHLQNSGKEKLSGEERETILLAAIIHDWGEAIIGDITYEKKTRSDEENEYRQIAGIINDIFLKDHPQLASQLNGALSRVIIEEGSKLGKIFGAIERVGFYRTALKAWQDSQNAFGDADLKLRLEWLTQNVFSNITTDMTADAEAYPPVDTFLEKNGEIINWAFQNMPSDIYEFYPPEEKERRVKEFQRAKQAWEEYFHKKIGLL